MPTPESGVAPTNELPLREQPGEFLGAGAEAVVRELGNDYVLKQMHEKGAAGSDDAERMRASLRSQMDAYQKLDRALPGRVAKTMFFQGKDEEGAVRNFQAQERVRGPVLYGLDIEQRATSDQAFREDLVAFGREVGQLVGEHAAAPDLSGRNVVVAEREGQTRLTVVDTGLSRDIAETRGALSPEVVQALYEDRREGFERELSLGRNIGRPPWEILPNLQHFSNTSDRLRYELSSLYRGKQPQLFDSAGDEFIQQRTDELRNLREVSGTEEAFIRRFADTHGQQYARTLVREEFGFGITDDQTAELLARSLLQ